MFIFRRYKIVSVRKGFFKTIAYQIVDTRSNFVVSTVDVSDLDTFEKNHVKEDLKFRIDLMNFKSEFAGF